MGATQDISTTQLTGKDYMRLSYLAAEALHNIFKVTPVTLETLSTDEVLFRLTSSYILQFNDGIYNFRNSWAQRLPMDDYYYHLVGVRNALAHNPQFVDFDSMVFVIENIAKDYKIFKGLFLVVGGDEDTLAQYQLHGSALVKALSGGENK